MAQEGGLRILGGHAAAVVRDAQEGHAAVLQLDGDIVRARVDRVLDQLLGGAGGTLHDLAGCDQVGDVRGKLLNFRHLDHLLFL